MRRWSNEMDAQQVKLISPQISNLKSETQLSFKITKTLFNLRPLHSLKSFCFPPWHLVSFCDREIWVWSLINPYDKLRCAFSTPDMWIFIKLQVWLLLKGGDPVGHVGRTPDVSWAESTPTNEQQRLLEAFDNGYPCSVLCWAGCRDLQTTVVIIDRSWLRQLISELQVSDVIVRVGMWVCWPSGGWQSCKISHFPPLWTLLKQDIRVH